MKKRWLVCLLFLVSFVFAWDKGYTYSGSCIATSNGILVSSTDKITNEHNYKLIDTTVDGDTQSSFSCITKKSFTRSLKTYSISYNLNNGSISGQRTSYTIETETFSLPIPTRSGYTFAGWTGSNSSTAQTNVSVAKGSTGNKSYTANWNAEYRTFDLNGYLDGNTSGNISGYGTVDIYVNGTIWANDVTDFYRTDIPYNAHIQITDIKATTGHTYNGVYSGLIDFYLTDNTSTYLKFTTNQYILDVQGGNTSGWATVDVYINGTQVAWSVTDWYAYYRYGTTYKVVYNAISRYYVSGGSGSGNQTTFNGTITDTTTTNASYRVATTAELAAMKRNVLSDGTYVIKNVLNSSYVLDVDNNSNSNGARIQFWGWNNTNAQKWVVSHDANGYIILKHYGTNQVMDVKGGAWQSGTQVWQYESNGTAAQKWVATYNGNYIELFSAMRSSADGALDIKNGSISQGNEIQMKDYSGSNSQKWIFEKIG